MAFISLFGAPKKDPSVFDKVRAAVSKTRANLTERIQDVIEGKKEIDRELIEDLESILLGADVGVGTTKGILDAIRDQVSRKTLQDPRLVRGAVKEEIRKIVSAPSRPAAAVPEGTPYVILMVGVNGVGKTTTIGKIAHRVASGGKKVLVCAADTFRAAAIDQLEVWANRADVPIIKTKPGGDPSAVLFDALQAAKARQADYVIVDTAGRLHTKHNLMAELEKMTRIARREIPSAPHEVLLVMDATTGQNGLLQAREFTKSSGVTGMVLTKLDGTAKGGVVVAITKELKIPIRFVGVGEKIDDLVEFSPGDFVESLFE